VAVQFDRFCLQNAMEMSLTELSCESSELIFPIDEDFLRSIRSRVINSMYPLRPNIIKARHCLSDENGARARERERERERVSSNKEAS